MHLDPSAYSAPGGPVGALLIHGFGGSVAETRPMGEYLAARGLTVRCPLLPGHGTTAEDLTHIHRRAWIDEVESAFRDLEDRCEAVFVGGLSMGSLLALWLGAAHPTVAGIITMAPTVQLQFRLLWLTLGLRHVLKYAPASLIEEEALGDPEAIERIWCYDEMPLWGTAELYLLQRGVHRVLAQIRQPILIFQGRLDNWLSPDSAQILYDRVASPDKTLIWLEHSGHNVLADGEREQVWAQSYAWMMERSALGDDGRGSSLSDHVPHKKRGG
jgi:carboxylesterase